MRSELLLFSVCCLLSGVSLGQWSGPVPLLSGSLSITGQSLVAGSGDTVWAAVVTGQAGSTGPFQVLACWTTGDSWSLPTEVIRPDSGWTFSEPGLGRDASGRLWIAWYRGDYPTRNSDSGAVWAAFRDAAGWHAPERVCTGVAAAGPMSFVADAQGNWYLGFAMLTPYSDFAYSSAVYTIWSGDSWLAPRYIARGTGNPFETDFLAPTLVARPDSGVWAAYDMSTFGDSVAMLSIVQRDTSRRCRSWDGSAPAATADSVGRLWVLYSQMGGFWLQAALVVDSAETDTRLVTDYAMGRGYATTDLEGIVWAAWKIRTFNYVGVNYSTGGDWSQPEQVSTIAGTPNGVAADANGRIYVLFRGTSGQLYSVYRTSRPGIQEQPASAIAGSRLTTVLRNVLLLPRVMGAGHNPIPPGESGLCPKPSLLDATGRKVMDLHTGPNDVSRLSPGVYFVLEPLVQAVRKTVVAR